MKFSTLLINQKDNTQKDKIMSEEELRPIVGDYVISRAVEHGETVTNIINNGQTYKMFIRLLKN